MKPLKNISILGFTTAMAMAAPIGGTAMADAVSDFYRSQQVKIVVGSSSGGGYDTYARTLARHLPNHVPGKPRMIVQNMPGAGGIIAANFVYGIAPQDGSFIGGLQRTIPLDQIMGHKGPKYDALKFHWLGSVTNEAGVLAVTNKSKVKTLNDVFTTKAIMGSTGPTDSEIYPALLNNTMGAKFEVIRGYPGSAQIHLALKRGEIEGYSQSWSSFKVLAGPRFLKNIKVLAQISLKPLPEMTKMGVPMVMDLVDRKHVLPQYTLDEAKTWWRLMLTSKAMGRPYALGPGVSADKVKAMRKAFMATATDPAFIADAEKQKREVTPISGAEVHQMIADLAAAPKATIAKVKELIKFKGKMTKVKIELAKHTGKVTKIKKGGRRIFIKNKGKEVKAKVSGSRTKVTVNGKKAKRKAVKVGMTCIFVYPSPGSEAKQVNCKN